MVNMYFNGKSFVYCRKQEEKAIKLTYRGSTYFIEVISNSVFINT